jgi:hypothetical protein
MLSNPSARIKERWREIRAACPVCGRRGWCRASPDGAFVACRRNEHGAVRTVTYHDGSHAYLHRLDGQAPACPVTVSAAGAPRANDVNLDRVYRALLARLSLHQRHRQQLQARGLSGADIQRAGYRTLPCSCRAGVLRVLREQFRDDLLLSVPGVIARQGPHGRYLTLGGRPGLLIPVRSVAGLVVGLVVRPDDPGEGGKYRWLSSRYAGGPSSGARVHVPVGVQGGGRVVLVEGVLKSDVVFALSGWTVVGLPGCWVTNEALGILRQLQATEALLAFDRDVTSKPHVAEGQLEGLYRLKGAGFTEGLLRWPAGLGKGLDDALLSWRKGGHG